MNEWEVFLFGAERLAFNIALFGVGAAVTMAVALYLMTFSQARLRYMLALFTFLVSVVAPVYMTIKPIMGRPIKTSRIQQMAVRPAPPGSRNFIGGWTAGSFVPRSAGTVQSFVNGWIHRAEVPQVVYPFLIMWGAGALFLILRDFAGHWRFFRARQRWSPASAELRWKLNWPDEIPLYIHAEAGPSTVGILSPAVILPQHLRISRKKRSS